MPQRYSLMTLRMVVCWFGIPEMAQQAGVPEKVVHHALLKRPIEKEEAEKILQAFSTMSHRRYTLDHVEIILREEGM